MRSRHPRLRNLVLTCLALTATLLTPASCAEAVKSKNANVTLPYVPTPRAFGVSVLVGNAVWYYGGVARNSLTSLVTDTSNLFVLPLNTTFTTSNPPFISHDSDATLFGSLSPPQTSWPAACIGFDETSILVAGGYMEPNDTLMYSYSTQTHLWAKPLLSSSSPAPPPRRREWTISFNSAADNHAYVFGGASVIDNAASPTAKSVWSNDLWSLDASGVWANLTASGTTAGIWPPPTVDHTAHVLRDGRMVIVGGRNPDGVMTDLKNLWIFDSKEGVWSRKSIGGDVPANRAHHTSVLTENENIIIFGGTSNWNATVFLNDVAVLNTTTWQWSIPTVSGTPPSVRWGHNADYAFGQMVIAFGENPLSGQDSDIYILDTSTWAWTTTFNPSYSDPTPDPTPVPDPTSTGTLDPSSTATPNSGVTSTVGTYIPPSNFTPVVAIAGGAVGGALIIVGAVGGVLLHLHRRRTADADDMPTVVVHGPRSRSPSRMGRSSTDTYAMRKHLSWSDMPGQPSGANTFLTPPSPVVAYADWATDAYMQATRRASRHYREDSGGSISVPILEGETDREESESPPLDEGVTIDTVEIDVDADEVDPEELYRHLEIQTIAVPKQALFVVNKD